ncbi:hypothetical protein [Desulfogranum mediterraneum]|uniref:hypothetical protein n=1 Tax=Desulfogranum mediterraneum TaxID=160661 RepID=UPI000418CC65|nr:hypothetical protein [Desulfogranum mediterraneum]
MHKFLLILLVSLTLCGCQAKQVRHLASDASLIQAGRSTLNDVQRYLGTPNGQRTVSPGVVEYVYYEDQPGFLGHTPIMGDWVDPEGYEMIIITLKDQIVTNCEFRTFTEADQDWADDFTWEEVK